MRNVVLLCLDTVREDYFAEFATRLADRADARYTQCRAASSWSVPSHASMFTGRLPSEHGVHAHHRDFSGLSPADTFLADLEGYATYGVSANVWASSAFGFDGLFDSFSDVSPDRRLPEGIHVGQFGQDCEHEGFRKHLEFLRAALAHDHPLQSLANGALVELEDLTARLPMPKPLDDGAGSLTRRARRTVETSGEPFFLFANLMDAHGPLRHVLGYDRSLHDAPLAWTSETEDWSDVLERDDEDLVERYRGLYAASIDYLDRVVLDFVDAVQDATDRETTVVVTADHGDNLGLDADDDQWGHVFNSLSEALLHVPLVVLNAPEAVGTIEEYVSHLRLGELVVGLAEGRVPDVAADRIPAERIGYSGKRHQAAEVSPEKARPRRCVYDGPRKYEWDAAGNRTVFELSPDRPSWQRTLPEADFDPADYERDFFPVPLAEYAASIDVESAIDVDESTEQRLEDLGYL